MESEKLKLKNNSSLCHSRESGNLELKNETMEIN